MNDKQGHGHDGPQFEGIQEPSTRSPDNGPTQIATTDPVVDREAQTQANRQRQPTASISTNAAGSGGTGSVLLSTSRPVVVETGRDEAHEASSNRPRTREEDNEDHARGAGWGSLAGALVVGVLLGLGGFWAYGYFFGSEDKGQDAGGSGQSSKPDQSGGAKDSSKGSGSSKSEQADADIVGFGSPDEARDLNTKMKRISERIDQLRMRVDRMKSEDQTPPSGLGSLQIRVGELSREMDDVAYLPEQVRRMRNELDDLRQKLRSQGQSLSNGLPTPSSSVLPPPTRGAGRTSGPRPDEPAVIDLNDTSDALERGMQLLEQGRPVVALGLFRSLETKEPKDARIWYLAALATGGATEDWNGSARHLVDRGLALERAGSHSSERVDHILKRLRKSNVRGIEWLDAYRRQVVLKD